MREDIDHLRIVSEKEKSEAPRVSGELQEAQQRIALLDRRLQVTMNEVTRLRMERRKLMDMGNELRAAILKVRRSLYLRSMCRLLIFGY